MMERVGAEGKYQETTLIYWSIANYLMGGMLLIPPFLFFQDEYLCAPQQ